MEGRSVGRADLVGAGFQLCLVLDFGEGRSMACAKMYRVCVCVCVMLVSGLVFRRLCRCVLYAAMSLMEP